MPKMMGCKKCIGVCGWIFLVLGILYMLTDFGFITFWKLNWWTALFLVVGITHLAMNKCPDCCAMKTDVKAGKKK